MTQRDEQAAAQSVSRSDRRERKQLIDTVYKMLIRRLPQPSLTRRCMVRIFGQRVNPVIETLHVVHDNYVLADRLRKNPELYEQIMWQYRVRCVSEYQRACEEALTPDPKPDVQHGVPVHITGMTSRGAKWTT